LLYKGRVGRARKNGGFLEREKALLGFFELPGKYLFALPGLSTSRNTLLGAGDNPMPEGARFRMGMRGLQCF
jgi:hypothetical protein